MLDTKSCRAEGGSLEVKVYRKKTHTDQYLNFESNHPLHHKLGVVRTLLDLNDAITTKDEEKVKEEEHIRGALSKCGYPDWAVDRVKKQRSQPKDKSSEKEKSSTKSLPGSISLPYVAGLSEAFARLLKKYNIQSTMKPCNTIRQNLVRPKDKRPLSDNAGVVYNIACKQCPGRYVGETGRKLGVRVKEHRDEVEKADKMTHYTRSTRKASEDAPRKSAITLHSTANNYVIDWDSTKIVGREDVWIRRQILETVRIRQEGKSALNRDGGNYPLPPLWGPMLVDTKVTAPKSAKQKKAVEVSTTIQSRQQSDEVC